MCFIYIYIYQIKIHNLMFLCFITQVDTAGWLQRTELQKGPASLSIMQSRKSLMRAHVIALVLDAEEVCIHLLAILLYSSWQLI